MVSTGCFHHLRFQKRRPPAPRAASAHVAQPGRCWDPPGPLGRSPAGPSGNDVENPWRNEDLLYMCIMMMWLLMDNAGYQWLILVINGY